MKAYESIRHMKKKLTKFLICTTRDGPIRALTTGPRMGCLIVQDKPADTDQRQPPLEKHRQKYGRMHRQVNADGGFVSKDNLAFAKRQGVKDAVFARKRGFSALDMTKSSWVYKKTSELPYRHRIEHFNPQTGPWTWQLYLGRVGRDSNGMRGVTLSLTTSLYWQGLNWPPPESKDVRGQIIVPEGLLYLESKENYTILSNLRGSQ